VVTRTARQTPSGARPNREAWAWLALLPGRLLERAGNSTPRGMAVHDRTRLIGRLPTFPARRQRSLPTLHLLLPPIRLRPGRLPPADGPRMPLAHRPAADHKKSLSIQLLTYCFLTLTYFLGSSRFAHKCLSSLEKSGADLLLCPTLCLKVDISGRKWGPLPSSPKSTRDDLV